MSDQYVAKINGQPITRFDYQNALQGFAMELHRKTLEQLNVDELKALEGMALEKLLARELIFQEAMSQGVVADENSVQEEKQKVIANFPSEDEFYATLEKAGIDSARYHRMIRQDLTVNLMTARKLAEMPDPSAEQIEETYRRYPEKMNKPARVRACHILVKATPETREQALERIKQLQAEVTPDNFAAMAQQHSQCPSASSGGDLGFFFHGDMVKPFADAAFSQQPGIVGEAVESPFGFHLIKVLEREEESRLSLAEATPLISKYLKEDAGSQVLQAWVEELKTRAEIEMPESLT